jgi:4-carboxymuconolactone decarboxylase
VSYRVASQLLGKHRIDDATYAEATDAFGETGLIELVSVIGYYCQISLTLNAFEIPLTASMSDPFPES